MIEGWRWKAIIIAIGCSAALVHIDTLNNGFVFDDPLVVLENTLVTGDFDLFAILSHSFWGDVRDVGAWRPLPIFTFSLNYAISGANPASYHLINTLLHGLTTVLVIILAVQLKVPKEGAIVAGALFAVHPIHVDCIAPVVGRADLFLGACGLASYILWEKKKTAASMLLLILSLLSKEMAVVLVFVFVWRDWTVSGHLPGKAAKDWRWLWPMVVLASWLLLRYSILGRLGEPWEGLSVENPLGKANFVRRFWTAGFLYAQLLKLIFFPTRLLAEYSYATIPALKSPSFFAVFGWLALLLSIFAVVFLARRKPRLSALLFLWTGCFLLVSNLILYTPMIFAERVFYLPSAALFILFGRLWGNCFVVIRGKKKWLRLVASGLLIIALAGMGMKSVIHVRDWRTNITLAEQMVRDAPRSIKWLNNACYILYRAGRISKEQAASYVQRSLNLLDSFAPTLVAAAYVALEYDKPEVALAQIKRAAALAPNNKEVASAWCAYCAKYDPPQALEKCTKAVKAKPRDSRSWGLLAVALDRNNEPEKAADMFQRAFDTMLIPDYTVYVNYGVFLVKHRRISQARSVFQFVVKNNPNDREAKIFLEKLNARFPVMPVLPPPSSK